MWVTVRTPRRENLPVRLKLNDLVETIKASVWSQNGIPPGKQRLIFADETLEEGRRVCSYPLCSGSVIELHIESRHGGARARRTERRAQAAVAVDGGGGGRSNVRVSPAVAAASAFDEAAAEAMVAVAAAAEATVAVAAASASPIFPNAPWWQQQPSMKKEPLEEEEGKEEEGKEEPLEAKDDPYVLEEAKDEEVKEEPLEAAEAFEEVKEEPLEAEEANDVPRKKKPRLSPWSGFTWCRGITGHDVLRKVVEDEVSAGGPHVEEVSASCPLPSDD